jgi:group I intron endonuclease
MENVCGIYCIERISDSAVYVGQSMACRSRINQHKHHLRKGNHRNTRLQRAYNKHGEESFMFRVLEICDANSLDEREQFHLDKARSGGLVVFNMGDVAACPNRGRKLGPLSDEHRLKIANAVKGYKKSPEECLAIAERARGRKTTDETKEKQRQAKLGRKLTDEHRASLSKARKGKPHPTNEAARQRLIERNKTMVYTPEIIEKMRQVKLGYKHTDEAKEKCRQASLNYWRTKSAIGE